MKYHIFCLIIPRILLVITQSQASESLNFCFNSTLEGHRLNTTVWMAKFVSQWMECVIECVHEPCCRSINYKKTFQNEANCEMLHDVVYNTSEKVLERNCSYDYVYLTDPQKEYNASCVAVDDNRKVNKNCADLNKKGARKDGIYSVSGDNQGSIQVRCDMTTEGGGWTIFQRRLDGSVDFYRGWEDYKFGFGQMDGEFWLGLDEIHRLSNIGHNVLRVDMDYFDGEHGYAEYDLFQVGSEHENYKLHVGIYSGDAGDSLVYHNEKMFSTKDRDNDMHSSSNCAEMHGGAWWYKHCYWSDLNGHYNSGISWHTWGGHSYSIKKTEMKFRPAGYLG